MSTSWSPPLIVRPVVLAGGKSTRMGSDKRFLIYEGKTWIDHAVIRLESLFGANTEVFISGEAEGYSCIPDLNLGQGPVMALWSVMNYFSKQVDESNWILFLPVDMPRLTSSAIKQILPREADAPSGIEYVGYVEQELPLSIYNSSLVREKVGKILQSKNSGRSIRKVLEQCQGRLVLRPSEVELRNFNYTSDLEAL